jgi:hypothetical protein
MPRNWKSLQIAWALVAWGLILLGADSARGGIVIRNTTVTPVTDPFSWDFEMDLTNFTLKPFGFITIYDVPGDVVGGMHTQPPDWTFSSFLVGATPPNVVVHDDPNLFNLTWQFEGTSPITPPTHLGSFTVDLTEFAPGTLTYAWQTDPRDPNAVGVSTTTPVLVPEPSALVLVLVGLLPLAIWLGGRGRGRAAAVA